MTDIVPLGENLGYLELAPNAVRQGETRGEPYAFRWDEIDTPSCPLGTFEYEVQINVGFGWFDANSYVPGAQILNDQHRRVLVLMATMPAQFRLRISRWTATPEQLQTADVRVVQSLLDSRVQAVRVKGLELLGQLDLGSAE